MTSRWSNASRSVTGRHAVELLGGSTGRFDREALDVRRRRARPDEVAAFAQVGEDVAHRSASACASSSGQVSATPERVAWTSPPPEFLGGDLLAGRRPSPSGGPPRKIVPWFLTITTSSLIAGTYGAARRCTNRARPATCARPIADMRAWLWKMRPKVPAVREHVGLHGQERAARVDQVGARQAVLERDLLRAQVLLDRQRKVGAALDGRVVRDDQRLAAGDRPMPVTMPADGAAPSYSS
jgi:hypothetical protein